MPGDIEVEDALLQNFEAVHAMLMRHHGSRSSSSAAFVNRLQPDYAVAQTGFNNRYHFPHAEVLSRYHQVGARVKNTADGAVMLELYEPMRQLQWREEISGRREISINFWKLR